MKLKDINEIKENGLVVFMPSGIQATLFNEDNNILVKYFNLAEDKYSKEDFKQLIEEGIFVFDKHINNPVMESKETQIKQITKKEWNETPKDYKLIIDGQKYLVYADADTHNNTVLGPCEIIDEGSLIEKDEECNLDTYKFTFLVQDEDNILVTEINSDAQFELRVTTNINSELIHDELEEQMDLIVAPELCDYTITGTEIIDFKYDEDTQKGSFDFNIFYEEMNESLISKLAKKGYIRNSLKEAFEQKDCKPGEVFTALKDKQKEYLTADFKIELLQSLDKIAKEYPDVHIRQQAQTFIDELGIQEYYDIKKVQKFIDKHIDIMNPTNESLKEELGEYANNRGLQDIAEQIENGDKSGNSLVFGSWFLTTSLDEKWNNLTQNAKDFILENIAAPVYDGHLSYMDLQLVFYNDSTLDEEDLKSMELFDDEQIAEILSENGEDTAYMSYQLHLEDEDGLEESFKVKKKKKKQKIEDSLHEDLQPGDRVEYLNFYGEPQGTGTVKQIKPGMASHSNLKPARIITILTDKGVTFSEDEYNVRKINEGIYLKDKEGKEIGPFENQQAKEQYLKDQKIHGNDKEYEEIIKEENMAQKNEDCYKVYSTIDPDAQPTCFNSWNEVEDHLNQAWGEYKASKVKQNTEFGTEQDKDDFFSNFDIAIEPIEVPVEEIPAEGIELDVADVCPECNEDPCVCDNETDENVMEEDLQEEPQEETNEQPQDDEVGDEIDDEGDTAEITTPEQAAEKVDDVEDALDSIEDFIQSLLDDEDEEQIDEMCMQKLPNVEDAKAKNKETDNLETEFRTVRKNALANPSLYGGRYTQKNIKDAKKEFLADKKAKTEDFSDNMGMLTDINDLDFPDALHDAVDTKEDGSLYRISDLAKELQDVKAAMEDLKNDFKSELTTMIQDLKNDLKLEVNNVENKVQDTKSAVDNLTSEEDDLEDLEMEQSEETEQNDEQPEEGNDEDTEMEEAYEKSLAGNKIFESIKKIIATNDHPKKLISIKTIAEKLREDYGINTNLETDFGRTTYSQVAQFINKTSLKECVCDPAMEEAERKKCMLGKAASWLSGGLMSRMQETRQRELNENIAQIKAEIDKKVQQGADAEQLKDEITLGAENEEEEKQAKQYAIDKLTSNQKAESLKSKLLKTSGKSVFGGMNIRG